MTLIVFLAADIQGVSQSEAWVILTSWVSELQTWGGGQHFTKPAVRHTPKDLERKNYLLLVTWETKSHAKQMLSQPNVRTCRVVTFKPWQGPGRVVSSGARSSSNSCPFQV